MEVKGTAGRVAAATIGRQERAGWRASGFARGADGHGARLVIARLQTQVKKEILERHDGRRDKGTG